MELRPFYLVSAENRSQVYAVGLDLGDEAITYRRGMHGVGAQFGHHDSAESALSLYSRVIDLALRWEDQGVQDVLDYLATLNPVTDPAPSRPH